MIQSVNLSQKPPKKDSHHLNNFKSTNNFFEFENQCNSNEDFNLEDSDSEINSPLRASKKKCFSAIRHESILINNSNNLKEISEIEIKSDKSKSTNNFPGNLEEKNKVVYDECDFINEENIKLKEFSKDYEITILSRDLDQTVNEINNIKIIENSTSNEFIDEKEDKKEKEDISSKNLIINEENLKKNEKIKNENDKINDSSKKSSPRSPNSKIIQRSYNNHLFRSLAFSPLISDIDFKKHVLNTYKGLIYAKKFLKLPSSDLVREKHINLPDLKGPKYKTLFLDLDETLIHACAMIENPEQIIKGTEENGREILIGFNVRPFCREFLKKISQYYEIIIFTAATATYAQAIVNFLDPYGQYINGILTRINCLMTKNGLFIKDLRIVKNREMKNMILVDNLSHSFGLQIENGIPIVEFQNNKKDRELKYLYDHLMEGLYVDDVRIFNRKKLKLNYLSSLSIEDLKL